MWRKELNKDSSMDNIEQHFENRIRHLRCTWVFEKTRIGPPHASFANITLTVRRGTDVWKSKGLAPRDKDAKRQAISQLLPYIDDIPDPCDKTIPFESLWGKVQKPICVFKPPPSHWFVIPEILGIDWEGSPRSIVQIACKHGVYIDFVGKGSTEQILKNKNHTHCVFGEHETHLVANPVNLQTDVKQPLIEYISLAFFPKIRLLKDKQIHQDTDWQCTLGNNLSSRALQYAALDAEMTRRLGLHKFSEQ